MKFYKSEKEMLYEKINPRYVRFVSALRVCCGAYQLYGLIL